MVYLVQHAEAKSADEDAQRDLSELGVRHARLMGRFLSMRHIRPFEVWHSGKLRAEHTARILGDAVGGVPVRAHAELNPNDDPSRISDELEEAEQDGLMIVGHLPYLERLAALLLDAPSGRSPVRFHNAGIVALARAEQGWVVEWTMIPQLEEGEEP